MRFRCRIGLHKWIVYASPKRALFSCPDCGKLIERYG